MREADILTLIVPPARDERSVVAARTSRRRFNDSYERPDAPSNHPRSVPSVRRRSRRIASHSLRACRRRTSTGASGERHTPRGRPSAVAPSRSPQPTAVTRLDRHQPLLVRPLRCSLQDRRQKRGDPRLVGLRTGLHARVCLLLPAGARSGSLRACSGARRSARLARR
jgi:hypothetical protein